VRPASVESALLSPWLLAAAIGLSFFALLGSVPLFDLDEGAFSEATRELLENGNLLVTFLDGEPRYDKPILIYWLQALNVTLLGASELAFRLPSALAASAWAVALHRFVREQLDRPTASVAMLVMVNTLVVSIIAKAAIADALLNLWLALTFFDIYRYAQQPSRIRLLRGFYGWGWARSPRGRWRCCCRFLSVRCSS
jgi:4-amino-4-deoxy-L-arabinose transferase-like glycosyltransferase